MSPTPTQGAYKPPAAATEPAPPDLAGGNTVSVVALAAVTLVLLLGVAGALGDGSSAGARAVWWLLAVGVVSATGARAALDRPERRVWLPATVALAAWLGGSLYYDDLDALGSPSAIRAADLALLAFGLPASLAVGRLVRSRVEGFRPTIVLDGLIVALAASAAAAAFLASVSSGLALAGDPSAPTLAYPAAALGFLAFSVWIIALGGRRPDRSWLLLTAGLTLLSAGGSAFVIAFARGTYSPGGMLPTVWLAGAVAVAAVAWQPPGKPLTVSLDPMKRTTITSVAAVAALALLVLARFSAISPLATCFAAFAIAAVIARAAVSLQENVQMFATARQEALTDSLTGLGNRRKLMDDLRRELRLASVASPRVLVLFDLDGFKRYNDTYGHPAGDALLMRLGGNLGRAIGPYGNAYRMGGDEFCVLVVTGAPSAKTIIALAASALSEQGEGFTVRSSHGAVMLPHEARDATLALRIADQRMYAQKEDRRSSATRQARDILLQVLHERQPEMGDHLEGVAKLALGVATRLDLEGEQLDEVVRAAELHDVGKMAIPDQILYKPGPLSPDEWAFVRQHTIIGERILSAAPALMPVAKLVRSSHEHFDGSGYPDGLAGEAIPLGARIVAVCDAFHAMTSDRPYRPPISVQDALAELQACAGRQFDPSVVSAFCAQIASLGPHFTERGPARAGRPAPTASRRAP
jgi:two-component system, cell cycle response regulator